jgi:hypothetical protein
MRAMLTTVGFVLTIGASVSVARAEEPAPPRKEVRVERRADGKRVYVAPPLVVEGKIQRPEAFFVLPPPKVGYEWPELRRDLLPGIQADARHQR